MIKLVPVEALRPGMYLHRMGGSWLDHPFWRSSFVLGEADIRKLREHQVLEVWIDSAKGLDVEGGVSQEAAQREADEQLVHAATAPAPLCAPPSTQPQPGEAVHALQLCDAARDFMADLFDVAAGGGRVREQDCEALVHEMVQSIERDAAALVSLIRVKERDDYTYMHSVAVCALMISLARQMGQGEDQVREAGMAGLLHDIGKARVPQDILLKPGKLTDEEFRVMKSHPVRGHAILVRGPDVTRPTLEVCLHHHEKMDGSGYPARLGGDRIPLIARMGAVCDVYDAVTSHRPYKKPWNPAEALRQMAQWHGHFDPVVFQHFVKSVGLYPVGSLVRLRSGRLAVVLSQNANLLQPVVRVFFDTASRGPIAVHALDLSDPHESDRIAGVEPLDAWGLASVDHLWMPAGSARITSEV